MTARMRSLSSVSCIIQVSEEARSAALPLAAGLANTSGAYLGVTVDLRQMACRPLLMAN
ncbi:MAG: hypothetical protein O9342_00365 [Beijerinckiaceae bacterium]|nr:hypothetical protein [Beijerinckiaceae bacterium]